MLIREIKKEDNEAIANLIRTVLIEFNVPKVGTAYADKSLDCMFETYSEKKSVYFILEEDGVVLGGAGISKLENTDENICELQKMYFSKSARGKGFGKQMIDLCLSKAIDFGFEKCYLETMPYMADAQKLYLKSGFEFLDAPIGNTGHSSCPVWMIKKL